MKATEADKRRGTAAVVRVGPVQHLAFVEEEDEALLQQEYDGHHICVYLPEEGGAVPDGRRNQKRIQKAASCTGAQDQRMENEGEGGGGEQRNEAGPSLLPLLVSR